MASKDQGEDIAFFLYLVPIVASIVYGIYAWDTTARTKTMPYLAYVIVAKSPYLFLLSLLAVCLAIIFEVRSVNLPERERIVKDNSYRLQWLAIIVLVISFAAALSVADYNIGNGVSVFFDGRYPLIYAFFLVGISLLLSPKQVLGNAKLSSLPDVLGLVLLVAGPVIFYGGLKIGLPFVASVLAGVVFAVIGLFLLLGSSKLFGKKIPAKPETVQKSA